MLRITLLTHAQSSLIPGLQPCAQADSGLTLCLAALWHCTPPPPPVPSMVWAALWHRTPPLSMVRAVPSPDARCAVGRGGAALPC